MYDALAEINWERWAEIGWTTGARVLVIVIGAWVGLRILGHALEPALKRAMESQADGTPDTEVEKRAHTLSHVIYRTLWVVVAGLVIITLLPEFGFSIAPLLAGTSLIALAVGFGAQSLVKDVISGLFIVVENQYARGDVVNLAGKGGVVEDVNLRRTVLRDLDGTVHSIPNGEVGVASNLTRSWSRVNLIISVSYSEDLDQVFRVINGVGQDLAGDPQWSNDIVEAPSVLGVEAFGDSGIDIRVLGVTQPIRQWDVMREFRRRVKIAFDREGIEIPYPHRTLVTASQKAADGLVVNLART